MLPSKGFFSSLSCPHFDAGSCDRPHCHFRHVKKEKAETLGEVHHLSDKCSAKQEGSSKGNDALLKHLVTEAVKRVLSHSEVRDKAEHSPLDTNAIVSDVVNKLQPSISSAQRDVTKLPENASTSGCTPSYKPTPISELKKRHIPVMYAPEKPSTSMCKIRRPIFSGKEKLQYVPKLVDGSQVSTSTYKPSATDKSYKAVEYSPDGETGDHAYIPSKIDDLNDGNRVTNLTYSAAEPISPFNSVFTEPINHIPYLPEDAGLAFNNIEDINKSKCPPNSDLSVVLYPNRQEADCRDRSVTLDELNQVSPLLDDKSDRNILSVNNPSKPILNNEGFSVAPDYNGVHCESMQVDTINKDNSVIKEADPVVSDSVTKSKPLRKVKSYKCDTQKIFTHRSGSHSSNSHKSERHKCSQNKTDHHRDGSKSEHRRSRVVKSVSVKSDRRKSDREKGEDKINVHGKKNKHHSQLKKAQCKESIRKEEKVIPGTQNLKLQPNEYDRSDETLQKKSKKKRRLLTTEEDSSSSCDPIEIPPLDDPILIVSSPESSDCDLGLDFGKLDSAPRVKKRISHVSSSTSTVKVVKPEPISPTKVLCERWQKARQAIQKPLLSGKVRISSVPNVSSILNARDAILRGSSFQKSKENMDNPVPKEVARIAHVPSLSSHPVVEADIESKVPVAIRQAFLNSIFEEYLKFYDAETAKVKAVSVEKDIAGRSKSSSTYKNAMAVARMRIRKNEGDTEDKLVVPDVWTSSSVPEFTYGLTLYECFAKYLLTQEELENNGYPQEIADKPGCAFIKPCARWNKIIQPDDPDERICINCHKTYCVNDSGLPLIHNDCHYHWGKTFKTKVSGNWTARYICCNNEIGSAPCVSSKFHVCELANEDCLEGFVKTLPLKDLQSDIEAGIYAMDCEMCATVRGSEVTRCTLVDLNGKVCFNKMIKPDYPIVDYCTRFSGVTEHSLVGITDRLPDIQEQLLTKINSKTILIGHSLENDLKVLKIFHDNVIDTSVVFPHKMGPPRKRALRHLTEEFLKKKIQNNELGHDSAEDAQACMDIMIWKVKEDSKARKPRVILSLDSK